MTTAVEYIFLTPDGKPIKGEEENGPLIQFEANVFIEPTPKVMDLVLEAGWEGDLAVFTDLEMGLSWVARHTGNDWNVINMYVDGHKVTQFD